jgi:hypothetical protein
LGIRARPLGFSWWAAVRESVMDTTGQYDLLGDGFFESLDWELEERHDALAGTADTIGVFEAKFCKTVLIFERETHPTKVTVKSLDFWDHRMSYGGSPFSIDYDGAKYDEITENPAGPSHVVLSKVSFFSRVAVGNDGTLSKIDWKAARSAILSPPAGGAIRPSPYKGTIHDISRSELDVLGYDKQSQTASYLVSVHFSDCREFVVWDAYSPHSPQPLTSPAELTMRDATLDDDGNGHVHELQLWHGDTYMCGACREWLRGGTCTRFNTDAVRTTV